LLYFENDGKLPETIDLYLPGNREQAEDFNSVIHNYFMPLLSKIDENCVYVNNLCVDINNRRCGIAKQLICNLTQLFPDKKIVLDCLEDNTKAMQFYKKLNFVITEHFRGYSGNQKEKVDCVRFKR